MRKRFFARSLVLLMLAVQIGLPVYAAGCLLTVDIGDYGPMLEGATLSLFLVGNDTEDGIVLVGEFAESGLVLTEENLPYGADLLAGFVRERDLEGTQRQVDASGTLSWGRVLPGIYLLMQKEKTPDDVTVIPFLIRIPDDRAALTAYPKVTIPNVTPQGPDLPQTGTSWWLVPVLALSGVLILAGGAWMRCREKNALMDK